MHRAPGKLVVRRHTVNAETSTSGCGTSPARPVARHWPQKCGDSGAGPGRGIEGSTMLDTARRLLAPSRRSDVPPFMVVDVMAAAARIEEAGGRVIHMEVGQPAAPAPATAIAAARAALV